MPTTISQCPFSHAGCRECAAYRGRHCYVVPANGHTHSLVTLREGLKWRESFKDFFTQEEETVKKNLRPLKRDEK